MESMVRRIAAPHTPGRVNTPRGAFQVSPGTIWRLTLDEDTPREHQDAVLVLDYNAFLKLGVQGAASGKGSRSLTTAWDSRFTTPRNSLSPHRLFK